MSGYKSQQWFDQFFMEAAWRWHFLAKCVCFAWCFCDEFVVRCVVKLVRKPSPSNGLHDRLLAWMDETRDPFRGYYWGQRPWRPDYVAAWKGSGMMRNDEFDGYLPHDLLYETGLEADPVTYSKQ